MIRLGKERDKINVVNDQFGSPTYAGDLAKACMKIIDQSEKWNNIPEVYHYSNEGVISWYDFAKEIMDITNTQCEVHPIGTEEYPSKAARPCHTELNVFRIHNRFKLPVNNWEESLKYSFL